MENTIATMDDLAERIKYLEAMEIVHMAEIKQRSAALKDGLRPSALLKNAVQSITGSPAIRHTAVDTSVGMAAGWAARKIFTLNSKNIFRKLLGYGLQYIATNVVIKEMPKLREHTDS